MSEKRLRDLNIGSLSALGGAECEMHSEEDRDEDLLPLPGNSSQLIRANSIDPKLIKLLRTALPGDNVSISTALELGLGSLFIPVAYGGAGLSMKEMFGLATVIRNETLRFVFSYTNVFAGGILLSNFQGPFFEDVLRHLARGNICSIALTEWTSGSDLWNITSCITSEPKTRPGFKLEGKKAWAGFAIMMDDQLPSWYVVSLKVHGAFKLALVSTDSANGIVAKRWPTVGLPMIPYGQATFVGVNVNYEAISDPAHLLEAMHIVRLDIAATSLQLLEECYNTIMGCSEHESLVLHHQLDVTNKFMKASKALISHAVENSCAQQFMFWCVAAKVYIVEGCCEHIHRLLGLTEPMDALTHILWDVRAGIIMEGPSSLWCSWLLENSVHMDGTSITDTEQTVDLALAVAREICLDPADASLYHLKYRLRSVPTVDCDGSIQKSGSRDIGLVDVANGTEWTPSISQIHQACSCIRYLESSQKDVKAFGKARKLSSGSTMLDTPLIQTALVAIGEFLQSTMQFLDHAMSNRNSPDFVFWCAAASVYVSNQAWVHMHRLNEFMGWRGFTDYQSSTLRNLIDLRASMNAEGPARLCSSWILDKCVYTNGTLVPDEEKTFDLALSISEEICLSPEDLNLLSGQHDLNPTIGGFNLAASTIDATGGMPLVAPSPTSEHEQKAHNKTLVPVLRRWCQLQPNKVLYTWLDDQGNTEDEWTYRDTEQRSNAVCYALHNVWNCHSGDRAILMYLPGLDFIAAFFGCLFARVVAVGVYPVDLHNFSTSVERFNRICTACQPKLVLTHSKYHSMTSSMAIKNAFQDGSWPKGLEFKNTDALEPMERQQECQPHPDEIAFLQFSSGSTGDPKGVMVSHGNLVENIKYMQSKYGYIQSSIGVTWLPVFHDMGLIGGMLLSAFTCSQVVAMSPVAFIRRPLLWLQTLSVYQGTHSAAPNFAYSMCSKKSSPGSHSDIDLAHVVMLMSAAEPVVAQTIDNFVRSFQDCGLETRMITPGYGLAEYTLVVTCSNVSNVSNEPKITTFQTQTLEVEGQAICVSSGETGTRMVSCGCWDNKTDLKIVQEKNEGYQNVTDGVVGEIWITGPSKAQGYWDNLQLSQETFKATLEGTNAEYLRTGDLGFLHMGELYVCGRLKDLIIVRGRNIYPQDLERLAEASHAVLRPGCSAAFGVQIEGEEYVVLVAEVRGQASANDRCQAMQAVRAAISAEYSLRCHTLLLVKERTIPKTTSGKIQRRACKEGYLAWAEGQGRHQAEAGWSTGLVCRMGRTDGSWYWWGVMGLVLAFVLTAGGFRGYWCWLASLLVLLSCCAVHCRLLPSAAAGNRLAVVDCNIQANLQTDPVPVSASQAASADSLLTAVDPRVDSKELRIELVKTIEHFSLCAQTMVLKLLYEVMHVNAEATTSFRELGMTSVEAVRITTILQQQIGGDEIEVSSSVIFDHPTVESMAAFVARKTIQHHLQKNGAMGTPELRITPQTQDIHDLRIELSGMACKLSATTNTPHCLWSLLATRMCGLTHKPPRRWQQVCNGVPAALLSGGFIEISSGSILSFKHGGFSAADENQLDCNTQLLLSTMLEALEDSGNIVAGLKSTQLAVVTASAPDDFVLPAAPFNVARSIAAALQVSGPYHNHNFACSSGHLAAQHALGLLGKRECSMAAVAGVSVLLKPDSSLRLYNLRILSPSGSMRPFDTAADGMVWGEACGSLVLSSDVTMQGSWTYARLMGAAANRNNALSPSGFVDPNEIAMAARNALVAGGIAPSELAVTHAHTMGNPASDIPEFYGLLNALVPEGRRHTPLVLVGHKANIGHSVCAAGVISTVVTSLALQHFGVPAHIGVSTPMKPLCDNADRVLLPTTMGTILESDALKLAASISGTSVSGDNVHLVLQESRSGLIAGPGNVMYEDRLFVCEQTHPGAHECVDQLHTLHSADIQYRVTKLIRAKVGLDLGLEQPFLSAGMTSSQVASIVQDISTEFRVVLSPASLFNYPTLSQLSHHLGQMSSVASARQFKQAGAGVANPTGQTNRTMELAGIQGLPGMIPRSSAGCNAVVLSTNCVAPGGCSTPAQFSSDLCCDADALCSLPSSRCESKLHTSEFLRPTVLPGHFVKGAVILTFTNIHQL